MKIFLKILSWVPMVGFCYNCVSEDFGEHALSWYFGQIFWHGCSSVYILFLLFE